MFYCAQAPKRVLKHFLHSVAIAAVAFALVPAPAEAAQKSHEIKQTRVGVAKKARVSKTFIVQRRSVVKVAPSRPSFGQLAGLHGAQDELDLKSSVALVIDQDTHQVLFRKNDSAVLPIASITKLMTGVIVSDAKLPLQETITITQDDVDTEKGSRSRLM